MPEQLKKSRSLIPLYIAIALFYIVIAFQEGGNRVLLESVSHESDSQVNLTEGATYKYGLITPMVLRKVNVTISKDSYMRYKTHLY